MFPRAKKPSSQSRRKFKVTKKPKEETLDIDKLLSEFKLSQLESSIDEVPPSSNLTTTATEPQLTPKITEPPSLLLSNLKTIGHDFEKLLDFGK